ncbi:hypothetical protein QFC21_002726 [Naganishia friedmannii]|uniref:Uncharacterized protein n=1 Tax=Naganishia friedmannii TaxID=89922 RepID=A0ACC2VUL7_9TREE|nr:hypothetical protein QFC21_002726 [Naganishia friedmannii]
MRHQSTALVLITLVLVSTLVSAASLPISLDPRTNGVNERRKDSAVIPSFNATRFQNPDPVDRPRFRYWVPSGNIDPEVVSYDVQQMAEKGFGGAEFLDLVGYGSNDTESDPAMYAWQSDASKRAMQAFYITSAELGLKADFPQGPNQGAGVPFRSADDAGTNTELARGTVLVRQGSTYNLSAPRPLAIASMEVNRETLVAIVTVKVASSQRVDNVTTVPSSVLGDSAIKLDVSSAKSHTVPADTTAFLNFIAHDGDYLLFTFWERAVGHIAAYGGFAGSQPDNNNTWTTYQVDHWSATGALAVIDSLKKNFEPTLGEYWNASVGKYLWEDSLEIPTDALPWTPGMIGRIQKDRGVQIEKYLPFLYANVSTHTLGSHYAPWAGSLFEATSDLDNHILNQQLTTGYTEYVGTLAKFAHSVGLEYSCQPGYGMPLDIQAAWPLIDTPEIESLFFVNNITAYRYATGAQHLSKKKVLSSEIGAVALQAYQIKWPALLTSAHTSFAGGINQFVWHGYAYSGAYGSFPKTPGWEAWFYLFSEAHGPRQPSWEHVRPIMIIVPRDSLARTQYVLTLGQPCVDLAFYRLTYDDDNFDPTYAPSHAPINELIGEGFTYEYVSPALFNLSTSVVEDGHLSPVGGPGYSALIFDNVTEVTMNGIKKAMSFAQAGLPVIFVGRLPSASPYFSESKENVTAIVQAMLELKTVASVNTVSELPALLGKVKVQPGARFTTSNTNVFSFKRWDSTTGDDYFYLYNDKANSTMVSVQLENEKKQKPYMLDTWSGAVTPIAAYKQSQGRVQLNMTLAPGEYHLITLSNNRNSGRASESSATSDVQLVSYKGNLVAKLFDNKTHMVTLDNGTSMPVQAQVANTIKLSGWSIDAVSWIAKPDNSTTTGHMTEAIHISGTDLIEFGQHPILANVSGTAVYTTTFPMGSSPHAHIDLGVCSHTCSISINGYPGPALNILKPVADISDLLVEGINKVEIEVSTPLGNSLRQVFGFPERRHDARD